MKIRRISLAMALIAVTCFSYPFPASAQVSFVAAPSFPAGTSPTAVAAGDFNGDGKPDLAVTNQHGLTILMNNGSGGFASLVSYTLGTNPQSVAVGDFDGNGKADLAVVNQGSGSVSILLGNGDGTFGGAASYLAGTNPRQVVVADVNGDGKPDLLIVDSGAGPGTSGITVLLGNGSGGFQTPATFIAAGSVSLSLAAGDFNGDGKLDFAVANEGSDNISVFLGNGNGTFQAETPIGLDEPAISVSPTSIVAADFDGDGRLDLAVATPNVRDIAVLHGNGDGTFGSPVHQPLDDPNFVNNFNKLAVADLNQDGKLDLVLCNLSSNHVTVLIGGGNGSFSAAGSYAAGPEPIGVAIADYNGDGLLDIAAADFAVDGEVSLLLGRGDGTLQAAPLRRSGFVPTSLAVGDLDGDGILDLVTASSVTPAPAGLGTGVVMLGSLSPNPLRLATSTFQPPKIWSTSVISSVALADFDGDGKLDLVETNPFPGNGSVSILPGKGDGTFQTALPYTAGTKPETVAVGDFNGDGKPDVVVGNETSLNISVLLNSGTGTLLTAVNYNTPADGIPDSVAVGDFDGNGKLDIAAAISGINATSIAIFLGNGDGTFQSYLNVPSGFHSSAILRIAAADFDGDGKADIAVTDGTTLSILLSSGGGAFRTPVTFTLVGPGAGINGTLVVGDFNGDMKPDLATTSRDGLAVFINNGDGTFPAPITYSPFLGGAIAAGDVDGNGLPDLITADSSQDSTTTDTVAVLINTSPVSVTVTSSPITGVSVTVDNPQVVEVCVTPCTFSLVPGTGLFLDSFNYFPSPGIGYVVSSWSDGGANPHTAVIPPTAVTYTVNMQTLYGLTAVASPASGGTISLPRPDGVDSFGNPFFKANSAVSISAAANPGYNFTGWTGPVADASNPSTTVSMTGPLTVTANFAPTTITVPNVVSFNVLFGTQSYNVTGSSRVRLPWQITGIRVVFSEPITSGGTASVSGAAATGLSGLGTNTLTWTISPIPIGNLSIVLSGSGPNALQDAAGNALNSGAGFTQALKILWGDFNDDGVVSASDLVLVNNAISQPYNVFADINGDGVVNLSDVQAVRARIGTSLP